MIISRLCVDIFSVIHDGLISHDLPIIFLFYFYVLTFFI